MQSLPARCAVRGTRKSAANDGKRRADLRRCLNLRAGKACPPPSVVGYEGIGAACTHISAVRFLRLMNIPAIDLTQRPPRSVRTRLGGYVLLPRMLDKCRAEIIGKQGSFHFACPNDQRILQFLGIEAEALKTEVAKGKGDGEIFEWIQANQRNKRTAAEIEAWSDSMDRRRPMPDDQEFFDKYLAECGPGRTDILCWSDLLDLDDFVSYGGKA